MGREIPFVLREQSGDENRPSKKGTIILDDETLLINVEGYGDCCSSDGQGTPIFIEIWEGELRVCVWSDINREDATHRISLEGAREEKREE